MLVKVNVIHRTKRRHKVFRVRRWQVPPILNGKWNNRMTTNLQGVGNIEHIPLGPTRNEVAVVCEENLHRPVRTLEFVF